MKIVVVGCGWLGLPLARSWVRDGHEVHGTTTRDERLDEIAENGVIAHRLAATPRLDGDGEVLRSADRVVMSLPPSGAGDLYGSAIAEVVAVAERAAQIVHVSSTGVYPDRPGHPETHEDDVAEDPTPRAARLLEAEAVVHAAGEGEPSSADDAAPVTTVLRLAGLWGYGRHPVRYLAGRTRPGGDAPVNLLHRDDAIEAVRAVTDPRPVPGTFAVVADDHPARAPFYRAEAQRLGLPEPRFEPGPSDGKRVVAERLIRATGFRPRWRPGDPAAP